MALCKYAYYYFTPGSVDPWSYKQEAKNKYRYYFLNPVLNSQGKKNYTVQYKKVQKSSWNEPYSSSFLISLFFKPR